VLFSSREQCRIELRVLFSGEFLLPFFFPVISDASYISVDIASLHLKEKSSLGSFNKLQKLRGARMDSFLECIPKRTKAFIAKGKISVGFFRDRQNC
jgi:hypothetical protein